jgi:hypothetical protein
VHVYEQLELEEGDQGRRVLRMIRQTLTVHEKEKREEENETRQRPAGTHVVSQTFPHLCLTLTLSTLVPNPNPFHTCA